MSSAASDVYKRQTRHWTQYIPKDMKVNKNTVLGDKIENKYNSAILSMGSQPKWERWISKCYNVVCDMFHSFTD